MTMARYKSGLVTRTRPSRGHSHDLCFMKNLIASDTTLSQNETESVYLRLCVLYM